MVHKHFTVVSSKSNDDKDNCLFVMETRQTLARIEDIDVSPIVYKILAFDNFLATIGNF